MRALVAALMLAANSANAQSFPADIVARVDVRPGESRVTLFEDGAVTLVLPNGAEYTVQHADSVVRVWRGAEYAGEAEVGVAFVAGLLRLYRTEARTLLGQAVVTLVLVYVTEVRS